MHEIKSNSLYFTICFFCFLLHSLKTKLNSLYCIALILWGCKHHCHYVFMCVIIHNPRYLFISHVIFIILVRSDMEEGFSLSQTLPELIRSFHSPDGKCRWCCSLCLATEAVIFWQPLFIMRHSLRKSWRSAPAILKTQCSDKQNESGWKILLP